MDKNNIWYGFVKQFVATRLKLPKIGFKKQYPEHLSLTKLNKITLMQTSTFLCKKKKKKIIESVRNSEYSIVEFISNILSDLKRMGV